MRMSSALTSLLLRAPFPQAHTIPMHATGAFGMPLAGTGFSAPTAWLNRTQVGGDGCGSSCASPRCSLLQWLQ